MPGVFRNRPDTTPVRPAKYNAIRPLTAAAAQLKVGNRGEADQFRQRRSSVTTMWQNEAWEYYDAIGEVKYAFNLVASIASRIRLFAAVVDDPAETPVPVKASQSVDQALADAAERALSRLDSAFGGQSGLLRDAALNLSVTGECYLVQIPARIGSGEPETWNIHSINELNVTAQGQYFLTQQRNPSAGMTGASPNAPGSIILPPNAFASRIWRPHPRYSAEPDSSMRGVLDLCSELLLLNRAARATERSRLNAGALYVPDGLSVAANPDSDNPYEDPDNATSMMDDAADEFEENLIEAMTTPIEDESSAAAVVPLIIRGPAELGDKIKQFKFERSFDDSFQTRSDRILERILQGLDVPKDTVTGLANIKYANAIQINESLYKAHIEPMLLLIADSITVAFLRPYLKNLGYDPAQVDRLVVWYDPSTMATRNDAAQDADAGYDKLALSGDTWRRAHGFSDGDAPTPNELILRILIEKGVMSPELSEALMTAIAPQILGEARNSSQASSVAPIPGDVAQALGGAPGAPGAPATPDAAAPAANPADSADNGADPTSAGPPPPPNLAEPTGGTP